MITSEQQKRLFSANEVVHQILKDAESVQVARNFLMAYIEELSRFLHQSALKIKGLEYDVQLSCLNVFRTLISVRSERLTRYSLLKQLWLLANERYDKISPQMNQAFIEEMHHLFLGMRGQSGIYRHTEPPRFLGLAKREAALVRSEELDVMAAAADSFLKRYPCGLDPEVIERRDENRRRIMRRLQANENDWDDYRWHMRNVIRTSGQLAQLVELTDEERQAIDFARESRIPFGITPYYVSLMDYEHHRRNDHAIRAQVIPPLFYVKTMAEKRQNGCEELDFMREQDTSPVNLVTRRYPNIAIFKPFNTCSQICVYCQRNWEIEDVLMPTAMASKANIIAALEWLRAHPAINEILITGGDPLVMSDERLQFLLAAVADIPHVERIRIGTRTPVVLPQRITDELMDIIATYHVPGRREVALVTHFEHPYEITPEAMAAVQQFRRRGLSVYNQAVFTIENSRKFELTALRKWLRLIGVDSYYTFNTKGKEETRNYRVPMARLQQEVKEEARLMPGLVRTDEPVYNVPRLGKNYLRAVQHHTLLTILPNGSRVYEFHPWEKNLALVDTYIDVDVPIYDYLKELERRGENPDDYRTIWYYF
ncbi:MAG: KamA family radical SAM protein [candidate division KSB1 bacterium]|nr:KamA family radical SAM protein [candidate division KSB1 bacterium]